MLGTINHSEKHAAIVGGGISGLLIAYRLSQLGFAIELFEAQDRPGGLIQTKVTPYGIAETAAHSFRASEEVLNLCEQLGVAIEPLQESAKKKYILREGKWRKMPLTPFEVVGLLCRMFTQKGLAEPYKPLSDVVAHHMGHGALHHLVTPMTLGIYGTTPEHIIVPAAFKIFDVPESKTLLSHLLHERKRKKGAKRPIMSAPRAGMQMIINKLIEALESDSNVDMHLNKRLDRLPDSPNRILCCEAPQSAALLKSEAPALTKLLSHVRYVPLITATVFVKQDAIGCKERGLGILIPPDEKYEIMGVLFNSYSFPGRTLKADEESFTVITGGTVYPHLMEESDDVLLDVVQRSITSLLQLSKKPFHIELTRWERAIPLYDMKLVDTWKEANLSWCAKPGNVLFGNYTGEVAIKGLIETVAKIK